MKRNQILFLSAATVLTSCGVKNTTKEDTIASAVYQTIDEDYMNKNVSPRTDFFEFSNGTWCKNNPVPESESRWGSFNELDKANKEKLLSILKKASTNTSQKGTQDQILGDYYNSFINFDNRNSIGIKAIDPEMKLLNSLIKKEQLPEVIAKLHKNGIRSIYGFGIRQDMMDVQNHVPSLTQSGIGLPNREYYFSKDKKAILEAYETHISKIFIESGVSEREAKTISSNIIQFETSLASAMMTPAEQRIPENTYNLMETREVIVMLGDYNFVQYLNESNMSGIDRVVVGQPEFVNQIAQMYREYSVEDWKNYLKWKVLDNYAGHMTSNFAQLNFDFYGKVLSGKKEMKPLEDQVIDEITGMSFNQLLGKAFVDENFSANAQKRVNEMVDNLLVVFGERIQNLSWMSADTKKEALTKLNSIGRKLGFPSEWKDFSVLNFTADSYLNNVRLSKQYAVQENYKKYGNPVNKEEWGMPAHMVNAYYHPLLNEIAFPAGIMQPPFFSEKYEDAVNYGRIGMVIGHEFTHGFDDMGSKFAADGTFKNWWTEEDRKSFVEKTTTFGQTYANFCPVENQCVNPELTMGENIADLGGLTLAYYAYAKTDEFKSGIKIKGYTPAQRFFISYAQLWKINYTTEELKNRLANDPHSPGMYRVNGPLMNCPEFFDAFGVKPGDKMRNDEKKVANIW